MRKIKYIAPLLILAISSLFISCEKNPFSGSEFRRVVVLYMAANNNLSSFAEHNISTIKDGFVPDKQSKDILVVYVHLPNKDPKLVRVYKESDGVVLEDIVATYTDQNSANGDVLKAVLNKIKVIFPANEYGLILWSHATGWLPQGYFNTSVNQGAFYEDPYRDIVKSFGEDRGVEMEVKELKGALPFRFSFIIFDCCFMGGIETIYELRDKADYIVASPTEILAYGFPYDQIMSSLFQTKLDLEQTCQLFYDYYNNQSGVHQSATISIYKTAELKQLADVTKSIFNANRSKIATLTMSTVQPFFRLNKSWFWDLGHLIEKIATPAEYEAFNTALNKVIVAKWNTPFFIDLEIKKYSGVSTYIQNPENNFLDSFYKGFDWNVASEMIK
ncbi:MAG: hypothetical protein A2X17_04690 [Bacteroidetes bacterium GWF2_41_61]|jgi:hypothetical protein|nr:MAG: hypothetical protein A2X20_01705 [Bacteroidetes bacterium GWE2_40_15]OFY28466.1 MAG: hypothetical protein A2X17_04690 [Bacteroidetes bacterium GWF2_41_61]PKP06557.1 MAG: hypothetical protein CVU10_03050 [Bacteroidetes bacterium HGW-Bacteroidetes-5]HBG24722.1 hypothetical protein [Rikenellaceae bacterium]HBZ24670.1 hypothetical protein [Rikenellaceae bacterium]